MSNKIRWPGDCLRPNLSVSDGISTVSRVYSAVDGRCYIGGSFVHF
jgi:hypothetical protein